MNYSIVKVKTKDELTLHGLFAEAPNSRWILIHVHGTAGNFYVNDFIHYIAKNTPNINVSFLSTNNRGTAVLQEMPPIGAATELFEDCTIDIDAWIEFALSKGSENIILQGHSLGSEKVVYYMNKGKYKNKIKGVILLGFSDSVGTQILYTKGQNDLIKEAEALVKQGKENIFLISDWFSDAGECPKNSKSYINFYEEGSELSKALPLHKGKLEFYKNIKVPILAIIGDQKEYTYVPIQKAIELLKKENRLTESHLIKGAPHNFKGKEDELVKIIENFLSKIKM